MKNLKINFQKLKLNFKIKTILSMNSDIFLSKYCKKNKNKQINKNKIYKMNKKIINLLRKSCNIIKINAQICKINLSTKY